MFLIVGCRKWQCFKGLFKGGFIMVTGMTLANAQASLIYLSVSTTAVNLEFHNIFAQ